MTVTVASLLQFWFADTVANPAGRTRQNKLWYGFQPATDAMIAERFSAAVADAATGRIDDWAITASGRLALIILLDQFPRNIFRGTPQAFRYDPDAVAHCRAGLAACQDTELSIVERGFFYLPLQHSEVLADQQRSVELCQQAREAAGPDDRDAADRNLGFAREHLELIARFGRFPHRNEILGREPTAAELQYLAEGGKTFGQSAVPGK